MHLSRRTHIRLHRRTDRGGTPHGRRGLTSIVRHMRFDQMARSEGGAEAQFAGEHGSAHDAGEFAGVFTGGGGVGAAHAEEVKHAGLGFEDGAAADGADFDGGHGDGDLEVAVVTRGKKCQRERKESGKGKKEKGKRKKEKGKRKVEKWA